MSDAHLDKTDFEQRVDLAIPFAKTCFDTQAFGLAVAKWCDESGEPALLLRVAKDPTRPTGFPTALTLCRMDPKTRATIPIVNSELFSRIANQVGSADISEFALSRPDYNKDRDGFMGNHLVVAILREAIGAINERARLPVQVYTGEGNWRQFCSGPGYFALLEQRALDNTLASAPMPTSEDKPPAKARARL